MGGGGAWTSFLIPTSGVFATQNQKKKMLMPDGMDKVLPRRVSRPLWRTMPAWMPTFQCLSKSLLSGGGGALVQLELTDALNIESDKI